MFRREERVFCDGPSRAAGGAGERRGRKTKPYQKKRETAGILSYERPEQGRAPEEYSTRSRSRSDARALRDAVETWTQRAEAEPRARARARARARSRAAPDPAPHARLPGGLVHGVGLGVGGGRPGLQPLSGQLQLRPGRPAALLPGQLLRPRAGLGPGRRRPAPGHQHAVSEEPEQPVLFIHFFLSLFTLLPNSARESSQRAPASLLLTCRADLQKIH